MKKKKILMQLYGYSAHKDCSSDCKVRAFLDCFLYIIKSDFEKLHIWLILSWQFSPGVIKLGPGGPVSRRVSSTFLNTPAWKVLVYLVRHWSAASGVFD